MFPPRGALLIASFSGTISAASCPAGRPDGGRARIAGIHPRSSRLRKIDELFARYGESHRNPANKAIHWVCVPLITWSVLAALWAASPVAAYVGIGARGRVLRVAVAVASRSGCSRSSR